MSLPLSPDRNPASQLPPFEDGGKATDLIPTSEIKPSVFSPNLLLQNTLSKVIKAAGIIETSLGRSITVGIISSAVAMTVLTPFITPTHSTYSDVKPSIRPVMTVSSCETFKPEEFIKAGGGKTESIRRTGEQTWNYEDPTHPISGIAVPERIVVYQPKDLTLLPGYPIESSNFSMTCHNPAEPIGGEAIKFPFRADEAASILGGNWKIISPNTLSRVDGPLVTVIVPEETIVIADRLYLPLDRIQASRFSVTHHPRPRIALVR